MLKSKKSLLICISAIMFTLVGCSSTMKVNNDNQIVTIPKSPKKLVVMNYGALDTLEALGKQDIVIGTGLSSIPAYLNDFKNNKIVDTGSLKDPNIQVIQQIKPDLIIIDGRAKSKLQQLTQIAPVLNFSVNSKDYIQSVEQHINLLANLTNTEKRANDIIQSLKNEINDAKSLAENSPKKAIVTLHNDGKLMLIDKSSNAVLIHDVLAVKRALPKVDIAPNKLGKPKPILVDNHFVKTHKPNIIYIIDRSKAIGKSGFSKQYFDQKILVKSKTKIVYLTPDLWYLSGGGALSLSRQISEVVNGLK